MHCLKHDREMLPGNKWEGAQTFSCPACCKELRTKWRAEGKAVMNEDEALLFEAELCRTVSNNQ